MLFYTNFLSRVPLRLGLSTTGPEQMWPNDHHRTTPLSSKVDYIFKWNNLIRFLIYSPLLAKFRSKHTCSKKKATLRTTCTCWLRAEIKCPKIRNMCTTPLKAAGRNLPTCPTGLIPKMSHKKRGEMCAPQIKSYDGYKTAY